MAWNDTTKTNEDGLYVKFHKEIGVAGRGGFVAAGDNGLHNVQIRITATDLGTAAAIMDDHVVIPAGAVIEEVEVISETACTSGGSAVLNIGLIRQDRSTTYDVDGLVAALALSTINAAGEKNVLRVGSSGAGALVGTTLANAGLITADYDTAAFTAGVLVVRIKYSRA